MLRFTVLKISYIGQDRSLEISGFPKTEGSYG
jgi:hypothetical protein